MASVQKFKKSAAVERIAGHMDRTNHNPSNKDIDPARRDYDVDLTPDHGGLSPYDYYTARLSELYIFDPHRDDIVTLYGWVVTLPREVTNPAEEQRFFLAVADFLMERYGKENTVSITIHRDETTPHLHYLGIPAVENNMRGPDHPQAEKLCCKEVINREELRKFHSDLQDYLDKLGIDAQVKTGVTGGKNRTVEQLKRETAADLRAEVDRLQEIERKYNELLQDRERSRWDRSQDIDRERGRW